MGNFVNAPLLAEVSSLIWTKIRNGLVSAGVFLKDNILDPILNFWVFSIKDPWFYVLRLSEMITLCNCLCSSPSSSSRSRFSVTLVLNIGEFGAKNYFTDHWTVNTIQLFAPTERKLFWSILFQNKSQRRVISYRLIDKYSHLFTCMSFKRDIK